MKKQRIYHTDLIESSMKSDDSMHDLCVHAYENVDILARV